MGTGAGSETSEFSGLVRSWVYRAVRGDYKKDNHPELDIETSSRVEPVIRESSFKAG